MTYIIILELKTSLDSSSGSLICESLTHSLCPLGFSQLRHLASNTIITNIDSAYTFEETFEMELPDATKNE